MKYHALIPAAGIGRRFGAEAPKQYAMLDGKPVLVHAIERLQDAFPLHTTLIALSTRTGVPATTPVAGWMPMPTTTKSQSNR